MFFLKENLHRLLHSSIFSKPMNNSQPQMTKPSMQKKRSLNEEVSDNQNAKIRRLNVDSEPQKPKKAAFDFFEEIRRK